MRAGDFHREFFGISLGPLLEVASVQRIDGQAAEQLGEKSVDFCGMTLPERETSRN